MPRFHALFSLGTVAGALVGTAMVALDVSVTAHLLVVGLGTAAVVPLVTRRFADDHAADDEATPRLPRAPVHHSTPGASGGRC